MLYSLDLTLIVCCEVGLVLPVRSDGGFKNGDTKEDGTSEDGAFIPRFKTALHWRKRLSELDKVTSSFHLHSHSLCLNVI
jgi:hypothetical protein